MNTAKLAILVLFFIMVFLLIGIFACRKSELTVENINQVIRKELPNGSTKDQVRQFIDSRTFGSRKLEFSHSNVETPLSQHLQYTDKKDYPKRFNEISSYISTYIQDVHVGLFTSSSISASFYFDKNEQLIDYTVKEWASGL